MMTETIITCAVSGSSLTPSMSPYLPWKPEDIVQQGVDAVNAGAAILHLHARNREDGQPTGDLGVWREIVPELRKRCNGIINMSASRGATAEERVEASLELRPDIATVIVGSMNYGRFRKAENQSATDFQYDWERDLLTGPEAYNRITSNSIGKIGRMIDILIDNDIQMEFECYDLGHLYLLEYHLQNRNLRRPVIVQFLTGILGGSPSHIDHLVHLRQTAERIFGKDCQLFTHGTGTGNMRAAITGALMGTNLRVGQEDNLFEKPGVPFKSNADQVGKIRRLLEELNFTTATPDSARKTLGLGSAA